MSLFQVGQSREQCCGGQCQWNEETGAGCREQAGHSRLGGPPGGGGGLYPPMAAGQRGVQRGGVESVGKGVLGRNCRGQVLSPALYGLGSGCMHVPSKTHSEQECSNAPRPRKHGPCPPAQPANQPASYSPCMP